MTIVHRVVPIVRLDAEGQLLEPFSRGGIDVAYVGSVCGFHCRDGADEIWLQLVNPDGRGVRSLFDVVKTVRPMAQVPITVWGGIQSASDARLLVELGADRVVVDVEPDYEDALDRAQSIADAVGPDALTVAMRTRRLAANPKVTWEAATPDGERSGYDATLLALELAKRGAGEIALMLLDEKGVVHDADLVERLAERLHIQLVSLGEERSLDELATPLLMGADAIASYRLFADGSCSVIDVKRRLQEFGATARPSEPPYAHT